MRLHCRSNSARRPPQRARSPPTPGAHPAPQLGVRVIRQWQRGTEVVAAKREAEEAASFAHEETMRLGAAFQDTLAHYTPEEYTEEHRAMIAEFVAAGRNARQTRARLDKATNDFERAGRLCILFDKIVHASTQVDVPPDWTWDNEWDEDTTLFDHLIGTYSDYADVPIYVLDLLLQSYTDYVDAKAAAIPCIAELVEMMEAWEAHVDEVPFDGTLDAVGLLDGLLERAMEGLDLLGGE